MKRWGVPNVVTLSSEAPGFRCEAQEVSFIRGKVTGLIPELRKRRLNCQNRGAPVFSNEKTGFFYLRKEKINLRNDYGRFQRVITFLTREQVDFLDKNFF